MIDVLAGLVYLTMAGVLIARVPRNAVGWILGRPACCSRSARSGTPT